MTEGQNFMELVKEKWTSLGGRGGSSWSHGHKKKINKLNLEKSQSEQEEY